MPPAPTAPVPHRFKRGLVALSAAIALLGATQSAHADITLPSRSWSQLAQYALPYDPADPLAQWLMMEDVDVWGRMRNGFSMPALDHELVQTHQKWFASRPEYFERNTPRAARYLYHVVQELEKRNMPTELALLPFIESAFNPMANSSAQAAGLWQFIPSTGRAFNLAQNVFMDERRSVLASTEAALTYLQYLHNMFEDWHLALAAYNWGEGSVRRAIKRAEQEGVATDFNGLTRYMPAETRNYVPKLQALIDIIAAPAEFDIDLPTIDNRPYFITINKISDIDVQVAAQLAELPIDEFRSLNPQFSKPIIPGGSDTQLLLPKSNAEKFSENLAKWNRALSSWTTHTVTGARAGVADLAKRFGTTEQKLREVNNIPPRMALAPGSTILVPKSGESNAQSASTNAELLRNAKLIVVPDTSTRLVSVKVNKSDTLSSIARRHKVQVAQIKAWNKLTRDVIHPGTTLTLHVPNHPKATTTKKVSTKPATATKKPAVKQSKKKNAV